MIIYVLCMLYLNSSYIYELFICENKNFEDFLTKYVKHCQTNNHVGSNDSYNTAMPISLEQVIK